MKQNNSAATSVSVPMEVHGKVDIEKDKASTDSSVEEVKGVRKVNCDPCSHGKKISPAVGFCANCAEYLCVSCFQYHKNLRINRQHTLLHKTEVSFDKIPDNLEDFRCSEPCDRHLHKIIEFFCEEHNTVLCSVCRNVAHASCRVNFIPDMIVDFKHSEELKSLSDLVDTLKVQLVNAHQEICKSLQTVSDIYSDALQKITAFRKEINVYLDVFEKELIESADVVKQEDLLHLEEMKSACERKQNEVADIKVRLEGDKKSLTSLFVVSKQLTPKVIRLFDQAEEIQEKTIFREYKFIPGIEIVNLLKVPKTVGELEFAFPKSREEKVLMGLTTDVLNDKPFVQNTLAGLKKRYVHTANSVGACCVFHSE